MSYLDEYPSKHGFLLFTSMLISCKEHSLLVNVCTKIRCLDICVTHILCIHSCSVTVHSRPHNDRLYGTLCLTQ